jgi:hypothetical protein
LEKQQNWARKLTTGRDWQAGVDQYVQDVKDAWQFEKDPVRREALWFKLETFTDFCGHIEAMGRGEK